MPTEPKRCAACEAWTEEAPVQTKLHGKLVLCLKCKALAALHKWLANEEAA